MKIKLLFILLTSIFIFLKAAGQDKSVRIALRAGLYLSRFSYKSFPSTYGKPKGDDAVYAGLQIDVPVVKKFSIVAEGLYAISSVQSYKSNSGLYHDELAHLLIPVMAKFKAGNLGLFLGPQAEILVKAEGDYVQNNTLQHGPIGNNSYRKIGYSAVAGAELVFKYRFGIDVRYQLGLGNYRADNGSTELTKQGSIKMNAFQGGLFFRFGKKRRANNS